MRMLRNYKTRRYVVIIKDKLSNLISRMAIEATDIPDALKLAREEKGETHEILSAILY